MGKGRCSPSSIPRCCLPSQLWGNTGLALPGLAPGLLAHLRRSQTDPLREQVPALLHVCQHRSADCRSHRAENVCGFWREGLQAVLSNSLPRHLGRRGPILPRLQQQVWTRSRLRARCRWRGAFWVSVSVLSGAPGPHGPAAAELRWVHHPSTEFPFAAALQRPAGAFGVISVPFCPCPNF